MEFPDRGTPPAPPATTSGNTPHLSPIHYILYEIFT